MPGMRDESRVTQELDDVAEAVEASEAFEAVPEAGVAEAVASVSSGGLATPDLNIYTIMMMISAAAYFGAILMLLFWLKDYSHPDQYLW